MRTTGSMRRRVLRCLLLLSLPALAAGCSKVGTVSGKISYKGRPVTGGTVFFFPEGKSGSYSSIIGTDGSYSIPKLPRGPAKISVAVGTTGVPSSVTKRMGGKWIEKGMKQMGKIGRSASGSGGESGNSAAAKDNITVPQKYADPDESGLSINVTGGDQTFNIDLD